MNEFDPLAWARSEAAKLLRHSVDPGLVGSGSYPQASRSVATVAAPTLDFFRRYAGGTEFYRLAGEAVEKVGWARNYLERLAELLLAFVEASESGLVTSVPYEVRARVDAANDLMEQVEDLLSDPGVHPAAPIALAGAALEALLRSLWEQASCPPLTGKPGLSSYASALQKAQVLNRQEVKDITAWAGRRNDAAHGHFDDVNLAGARLMAAGVNLFIQQRAPKAG